MLTWPANVVSGSAAAGLLVLEALGIRLENQGHVRMYDLPPISVTRFLLCSHHGSGRRDEEVVLVEFTARRGGGGGGGDLPERIQRGARSPGGVTALGFARTSHAMGVHAFDERW